MPGRTERTGPKGWYRRFLPHCDEPGIIQFITYRLADSVPAALLEEIETYLRTIPPDRIDSERRRKFEEILDQGHGSGVLREPSAANCVIQGWRHFDGTRYDLIAYVVMPTHVHVLIRTKSGQSLPKIVQSWKSHSGRRLKSLFPHACVKGEFWRREYWDRYIRDERHFWTAIDYIRQNPVKAGLANSPAEWSYSSFPYKNESVFGHSDAHPKP